MNTTALSSHAQAYLEQFRDAPWVVNMTTETLESVAHAYFESYWNRMEADTKRLSDSK